MFPNLSFTVLDILIALSLGPRKRLVLQVIFSKRLKASGQLSRKLKVPSATKAKSLA